MFALIGYLIHLLEWIAVIGFVATGVVYTKMLAGPPTAIGHNERVTRGRHFFYAAGALALLTWLLPVWIAGIALVAGGTVTYKRLKHVRTPIANKFNPRQLPRW